MRYLCRALSTHTDNGINTEILQPMVYMEKTVRFLAFLTSVMDSATSNYVKNVVHSLGLFFDWNLLDSVIGISTNVVIIRYTDLFTVSGHFILVYYMGCYFSPSQSVYIRKLDVIKF